MGALINAVSDHVTFTGSIATNGQITGSIVKTPTVAPAALPDNTITAAITLDVDIATIGAAGSSTYTVFAADFAAGMGSVLGVDSDRIIVNSVTAGSVSVDFSVLPDPETGTGIPTSTITTAFAATGVTVGSYTSETTIAASAVAVEVTEVDVPINIKTAGASLLAPATTLLAACATLLA